MANSIRTAGQSASRLPARLLVLVLLLGAPLAWWGTRDHRHSFGEPPRGPVLVSASFVPQGGQDETAILAQGFRIEQRECAGCHDPTTRSTGPSYQEVVRFYRRQSAPHNGKSDLLSALAAAVVHPSPGWSNFLPGPSLSDMTPEERVAVASWILNLSQKTGVGESPRK